MTKKTKTVLIVDDEEDIVEFVSLILEDKGFQTIKITDAHHAFEIIKSVPLDLVISDIRMPKLSGIELMEKARQLSLTKPVFLFLSGYSEISLEEAYEKGAAGFIHKPFKTDDLLRKVEELLRFGFMRKYERKDIVLNVVLQFSSVEEKLRTTTINIGRGGMFVRTEKTAKLKDQVQFEIKLSRDPVNIIDGQGEVVWIRNPGEHHLQQGVGIKFTKISPLEEEVIAKIVEQTESLPNFSES